MTKHQLTKIALELGWEAVEHKTDVMISFLRPGLRANYYVGTGTLTIQDRNKRYDPGRSYRKITPEQAKEILK